MRTISRLPGRTRALHLAFAIALSAPIIVGPNTWAQGAARSSPEHDVRMDARDAHGLTPLIVAASMGQTETVRSLLAQGAGIDARSADGRTPLIAAAQGGQIEAVQALIAAGANLNAASRGTGTALEVAERTGKTDIAALLLASGARSSGHSVGDTVCVLPWSGDGFCGTVKSFSIRSVSLQVTKILGCTNGCSAKEECSESRLVGGVDGLQAGSLIAVPSWCLTQTGVKP
ncbi:MAG: ankyrin repeat domain-containing protein [Terracidiphilus sp.]